MSSVDTNLGGQNKRSGEDNYGPIPKKKRTSAYDANFEKAMRERGVYVPDYRFSNGRDAPEPTNLEDMIEALSTRRASISSDEALQSMRKEFVACSAGHSEAYWKQTALPLLKGNKQGFVSDSDVTMTNFDPLIKYDAVVRLKPDIYDGAASENVNPTVLEKLNNLIVPTRFDCKLVCPNFFMEVKRPEGVSAVLRRQAMHAGALGARAMHSLQNYGQRVPTYDDQAHTISVTFQEGRLLFFAHHVTPGVEGGIPEYFMTLIDSFEMSNRRDFPKGVIAFRNARDWAKSTRDKLIEEVNKRASSGTTVESQMPIASSVKSVPDSEEDGIE